MPETPEEVIKQAKDALNAFETIKTEVLPLKKRFEDLDADTKGKFEKAEKAIGDAVELAQKEAGARKALEEQTKAIELKAATLEGQVKALETAMARSGSGSGSVDQAKELAAKRNKLFNEFAREPGMVEFDKFLAQKAATDPEIKALTTGSDPAGGYLVLPERAPLLQARVFETSPIRQLATVQTVNTDQYEIPLDNDEAAAGWVGETATRPETNTPTLGKLIIAVNEMSANPRASQKMLDDGIMDIEAWLAGKVSEIFDRTEATAFVSGNGNLKPKGLLSYAAGTTIASQQVEQVNSGTSGAFTYAGLVDLQNALKEEYQPNAVFLIKRATNAALMKIMDGESRPIFNMTYDKNVGLTPTIMGKPVYFANDMETIASASLSAIYGDIRRAYLILDRMGVRVLRDPFSAKPYVQFYTTKRVGGAVTNFEAYKIQKLS